MVYLQVYRYFFAISFVFILAAAAKAEFVFKTPVGTVDMWDVYYLGSDGDSALDFLAEPDIEVFQDRLADVKSGVHTPDVPLETGWISKTDKRISLNQTGYFAFQVALISMQTNPIARFVFPVDDCPLFLTAFDSKGAPLGELDEDGISDPYGRCAREKDHAEYLDSETETSEGFYFDGYAFMIKNMEKDVYVLTVYVRSPQFSSDSDFERPLSGLFEVPSMGISGDYSDYVQFRSLNSTPEPATLAILGAGLLGSGLLFRRKRF